MLETSIMDSLLQFSPVPARWLENAKIIVFHYSHLTRNSRQRL